MGSVPGFACPQCNARIVISMEALLAEDGVECGQCGLTLLVDRERSAEALSAVSELQEELEDARRTVQGNVGERR